MIFVRNFGDGCGGRQVKGKGRGEVGIEGDRMI